MNETWLFMSAQVRQDFWFFLIEEENLCDEYSAAKSHN